MDSRFTNLLKLKYIQQIKCDSPCRENSEVKNLIEHEQTNEDQKNILSFEYK
jgi:hypothetical protein